MDKSKNNSILQEEIVAFIDAPYVSKEWQAAFDSIEDNIFEEVSGDLLSFEGVKRAAHGNFLHVKIKGRDYGYVQPPSFEGGFKKFLLKFEKVLSFSKGKALKWLANPENAVPVMRDFKTITAVNAHGRVKSVGGPFIVKGDAKNIKADPDLVSNVDESSMFAPDNSKTPIFVKMYEGSPSDIKAKHPGVTGLPDGAWLDWDVEKIVNHLISSAKKRSKGAIARAVNNIARWNKERNPELSKKASTVMKTLSSNSDWKAIPAMKPDYSGLPSI